MLQHEWFSRKPGRVFLDVWWLSMWDTWDKVFGYLNGTYLICLLEKICDQPIERTLRIVGIVHWKDDYTWGHLDSKYENVQISRGVYFISYRMVRVLSTWDVFRPYLKIKSLHTHPITVEILKARHLCVVRNQMDGQKVNPEFRSNCTNLEKKLLICFVTWIFTLSLNSIDHPIPTNVIYLFMDLELHHWRFIQLFISLRGLVNCSPSDCVNYKLRLTFISVGILSQFLCPSSLNALRQSWGSSGHSVVPSIF
jgi:hypothetical protein